jgi:hypothetical protein
LFVCMSQLWKAELFFFIIKLTKRMRRRVRDGGIRDGYSIGYGKTEVIGIVRGDKGDKGGPELG